MKEQINMLIRNGLVFDGTGSGPFQGDIGIAGDRVAFVNRKTTGRSRKTEVRAEKVIDARDMAVAPGFIDTHAHSEFTLLADPRAEGKICQGITTEINGNCGLSAAPLFGEALKQREEDLRAYGIRERWETFEEYFEILERMGVSLNFMTLVGHGNLRACIAGFKDSKLTTPERMKMHTLLGKSIQQGAAGISTGLIYPPGVYSDTVELIELCNALSKYYNKSSAIEENSRYGIYTSHMRSEGDQLIESIDEIIKIGVRANTRVHISHIKTSGEKNWHKIDDAISKIEEAQDRGVQITCDRYPYTASSTDLDAILPPWVYEGGAEAELKRLKNPKVREKIKREVLNEHPERRFWETISIASLPSRKNRWMEGKSITDIAQHEDSKPIDIFFKILIEEKLRTSAIFSSMSEDNLRRFLSLPYVMIGTDSSVRSSSGPTCKGKPHPRGFGSFPRFLGKYVRDYSLMNISEAIHKITMLPARIFGIRKRGIIKIGAFADIVVFDHNRIIDRATFDEPFLKPEGILCVIINGIPALWEGELTGLQGGRILRHGR
jgi:N-acyl-D-amino-acid deacylase